MLFVDKYGCEDRSTSGIGIVYLKDEQIKVSAFLCLTLMRRIYKPFQISFKRPIIHPFFDGFSRTKNCLFAFFLTLINNSAHFIDFFKQIYHQLVSPGSIIYS